MRRLALHAQVIQWRPALPEPFCDPHFGRLGGQRLAAHQFPSICEASQESQQRAPMDFTEAVAYFESRYDSGIEQNGTGGASKIRA